jgi:protein-S-isoprenylcysteine O-methyltransferase Ste14
MMDTAWYFRLFYLPILTFIISLLLSMMIKAKRMGFPEGGKTWMIGNMTSLIVFLVLLWFVPFSINLAFWIGIDIIVFGEVVFALGYLAMREHPEKKQTVVDWGIYKVSRHSHALAGIITNLGVIVMGWNLKSIIYIILWAYLVLDVIFTHFYVLMEEKRNIEKFGQEYEGYMNKTPRYIGILKSASKL